MEPEKKAAIYKSLESPQFDTIVRETFNQADINHNGEIDRKEFGLYMESINIALGIEGPTAKEMAKKFMTNDKDNNGSLDFNEFKNLMKEGIKKFLDEN